MDSTDEDEKHLRTPERGTDGNGNSLDTHLELISESGSSRHSETHPEVTDDGIHPDVKDLEILPELISECGSSRHSETHPEVTDDRTHPEVIDDRKNVVLHPDTSLNKRHLLSPANEFRSSSTPSSPSFSKNLFQVNSEGRSKSMPSTTWSLEPEEDTQLASKGSENDVSGSNSFKPEALENRSSHPNLTCLAPQVSIAHGIPPTQSPPKQVMDRSGEFDPKRIPSSIFTRGRSTVPPEWSTVSNESLFSIHLGNNSFSTDRAFTLGAASVKKSGKFTKADDFLMFSSTPPPVLEINRKSVELGKSEAIKEADESIEDAPVATTVAVDESIEKSPSAKVTWNSAIMYNPSDDRETSCRALATFPMKKKKKKKCACIPLFCLSKKYRRKKCGGPSCYCSSCSCMFWNCSWPRCRFRWPDCNCSDCNWAFCYCWNGSHKRCSQSPDILTDGDIDGPIKANVGEHQSKSAACNCNCNWLSQCNWFSFCTWLTYFSTCACFRCRCRCCCRRCC